MKIAITAIKGIEPKREHGDIGELKVSIAEVGLINPLTVDQEYNLLAGRRRFQAIVELGWVEADVRVIDITNPLQAFKVAIDENIKRKPLTGPELASIMIEYDEMAKQLYGQKPRGHPKTPDSGELEGWTQEKTAKAFGTSPQTVSVARQVVNAIERYPQLAKQETGTAILHEFRNITRQAEIKEQKEQLKANPPQTPEGLFEVIVIDPPWPYGTEYDSKSRRVGSPYPEMSIADISNLQLPTTDDCVLWLWTTHRFMRPSFQILDSWGFREVSIVTWVKDRMGIGSWLRSQSEFCIMAVKGNPKVNLTNQTTVLNAPMREHTRKPDEFYTLVDSLCYGRKLDYFSREVREDWEQFGDETSKFE